MNIHREENLVTAPLLADYQLESWLHASHSQLSHASTKETDWQQLTQYAAYHVINEWYSLPAKLRTQMKLNELFQRRWTNKVHMFSSPEFYRDVKRIVTAHLFDFLSDTNKLETPLMLFENMNVYVKELDIRLSMIIQVMEPSERSFHIHKYVMNPCQAALELFTHMSVIFCYEAFGQLPEQLYIYRLMSGERQSLAARDYNLSQSMDYLRLVKEVYMESRSCSCCSPAASSGRIIM
ncbi:hypothetical protein [Paenibacillus alba]|uniref:Uncharacterized protein n=1 Tax=Paenibacillus alba TaxID=1197127 RepID=A0ABU6G5L8_9BACL|nr:hypothetical protein [Paenibacillus alba]MEC0229472.1 hypothetical protein [Paenibacillus alba]